MANYSAIKAAVNAYIKANGKKEITGRILNSVLNATIDSLGKEFQFGGVLTPADDPGQPDQNVAYIGAAGTYSNFDNLVIESGNIGIFLWNGDWSFETIPVGKDYDNDIQSLTNGLQELSENIQELSDNVIHLDGINEEDLSIPEGGKLQFANRVYNAQQPNGMGYVILRKNKTFAEQVTKENTIYEIRYEFDLSEGTVTIPSGCVLKFCGGRLSNGTATGNNTSIEAGDNQIFDGVSFDGAWVGDLNACWVGAKKNDNTFDNSSILQAWFDNYCTCFPNIIWPRSNYYFSSGASLSIDKRNKHIVGDGSLFYVNIGTDETSFITLNIGEGFKVSDVCIINSRKTGAYNLSKNYAIHFIGTQQFTVEDVEIAYFDRAIYLSDVYYGQVYGRVSLTRNRIGIFMDNLTSIENNTMLFENVRINGCQVEAAKALYPQNTGESEEDYLLRYARCGVDVHGTTFGVKYRGIVVEGVDYGIRYNYRPRSTSATANGLVIIDGCYFETNTVNDIYIGRGYVINPNNFPNYYANASVVVYANSCVFHGNNAVNVFVKDCVLFIDCVLKGAKVVTSSEFGRTKVFHSDNVIVESGLSQLSATIEKGFNLEAPSLTGTVFPSTSRQTIVGLERNGVQSVMSPAGIDQSTYIQNGTALSRFIPERFSVTGLPDAKYVYGIQPNTLRFYNDATYVEIPSGSGVKSVKGSSSNEVISSYTIRTDGIELYEFIRRWKAGIEYTGYVNQVFPYKVRSVPSTGLIYMENHAGVEAVYGFGEKAIDDNTITFATGKIYLDIETLCVSFYGYSTLRFMRDLVQCGRTYEEMLSSANSTASYRKAGYLLTTALRDAMTPRFNAIIYNSTTKQHEIYDGFQWVALTDPFKRYIYNDSGKSIAERATVPDLPNQTYYNAATGIEYKYTISGDKTSGQWVGGIGHVLSLTNPNGYDATSNPLDYATELSAGEVVQYDGAFYKWDGTQFVAL